MASSPLNEALSTLDATIESINNKNVFLLNEF